MSDPVAPAAWLRLALALTAPATALTMVAVARGWTAWIDRALLQAIAFAPEGGGRPTRFLTAARDLVALGGDLARILFVAACAAGSVAEGRPRQGAAIVAIFTGSRLALFMLKRLVRRPRPDLAEHGVATFTSSFPSGHTFMAVVTYLSSVLLLTRHGPPALVATGIAFVLGLSLAIGVARVGFRVHWPTDVIAGWLAGIAWTAGCFLAFGRLIWR